MSKDCVNIILFGAPGAGKGTQAQMLKMKYGLSHISTGEVIRQEIASGSELGKNMEDYITRGELAPDELVVDMVADFVERHRDTVGNIFDGFPRTLVQAEEFERIMKKHGITVDMMICLDAPEEELVRRLLLRGLESGRADDGGEEVIRNRLKVYHQMTEVVADYYARTDRVCKVDGAGSIDDVFRRLCETVDKIKESKQKA